MSVVHVEMEISTISKRRDPKILSAKWREDIVSANSNIGLTCVEVS